MARGLGSEVQRRSWDLNCPEKDLLMSLGLLGMGQRGPRDGGKFSLAPAGSADMMLSGCPGLEEQP